MSRFFTVFAFLFIFAATSHAADKGNVKNDAGIMEKAQKLHKKIITIDTHLDFQGDTKILDKMATGGMDGAFFAIYTEQKKLSEESFVKAYEHAVSQYNTIKSMCEMNPAKAELAFSPKDVEKIRKKGKRIVLIGMENGFPIGKNIENLKFFYSLGVRYVSITHMGFNQLADSSDPLDGIPAENYSGLSDFGKKVISEMNRLGMIIDVSHAGPKTVSDILAITKAPVIASHSACRALCDVNRNLTDEQMIAIRDNGGVVQIVAFANYLKKPGNEADIKVFADHIDHAVKLIGIDHVGIAGDFNGGGGVPGFNDPSESMNVTAELIRRGYSDSDIGKLWGGNLLRVWKKVIESAE